MDYGIIFCRTKVDCDNLEQYLNKMGGGKNSNQKYSCTVLHGDRKPHERKANLEMFKQMDCSMKNIYLNVHKVMKDFNSRNDFLWVM